MLSPIISNVKVKVQLNSKSWSIYFPKYPDSLNWPCSPGKTPALWVLEIFPFLSHSFHCLLAIVYIGEWWNCRYNWTNDAYMCFQMSMSKFSWHSKTAHYVVRCFQLWRYSVSFIMSVSTMMQILNQIYSSKILFVKAISLVLWIFNDDSNVCRNYGFLHLSCMKPRP